MEKLFKNKTLISIIAVILAVAAILIVPRMTGKPSSDVSGGVSAAESSVAEISRAESGELSSPEDESAGESGGENVDPPSSQADESDAELSAPEKIAEDGSYTSKEDVALYIRTYGKLPGNFITKTAARELGWEGGDLWRYAPGKSIGGDVFGNREGLLPKKSGRTWYECDIDYSGGSRGAKRIVYSSDGLIYYTGDHYESFASVDQGGAS